MVFKSIALPTPPRLRLRSVGTFGLGLRLRRLPCGAFAGGSWLLVDDAPSCSTESSSGRFSVALVTHISSSLSAAVSP
ncbi:hypothetical protein MRX96_003096 [Rhipicephalus microplus]